MNDSTRPVARLSLTLCLGIVACDISGEPPISYAESSLAPSHPARVVQSFPHDPDAFTQGLVVYGDTLLESTGGRGESTLRKVALRTGAVLREIRLPERYFGEGVAMLGDRVYQLTWQESTAFVYDRATLKPAGSIRYRGEGWGLTSDGQSLIMSDGTNVLQFLDPATFAVERKLEVIDGEVPIRFLNELEWVRGEIWANVWHQDQIARIDPRSGRVIAWLDLSRYVPPIRMQDSEAVPNGIAYDEATGRLFVTGKRWGMLYELEAP